MTLSAPPAGHALDKLCVNTLRFLAVDMVQQADSGYPGLPLGSAAMSYALWDRYLAAEFTRVTDRRLTARWATDLPVFSERDGPLATRVASGKGIAALSERLPELMGGAADLAPSTHTNMAGAGNYGVSRVAVKA